jgi:hypothetical protein
MVIDRDGARRARRMTVVACTCLIAVAGCASTPAPQPTTNPPTAAPIFESDEEALAAATEAYANYLRVHDLYWAEGGSPEQFLDLSTGSAHAQDVESIEAWRESGWRGVGVTSFDSMSLQGTRTEDGLQSIDTYVCLDVSESDVVDGAGMSVAKPDRPLRLPMQVGFVVEAHGSTDLKVARSEVWQGKNFC